MRYVKGRSEKRKGWLKVGYRNKERKIRPKEISKENGEK
jgi:hypothetical protein